METSLSSKKISDRWPAISIKEKKHDPLTDFAPHIAVPRRAVSCFKDGLHPTDASYLTIRDAIYDAFDGKNQPQDSPKGGEASGSSAGTALVSELKANNPSSDWSFADNKVAMTSLGYCLSSSVYGDFSAVIDFTGISPSTDVNANPFFSHVATKGFLFGGSADASGNYQGYALNVSYDWFEILKLNGTSSTFIDGFNMGPEGVKVNLTISGTTLMLRLADGTSLSDSFNKKTEITLSDYAGGKIGAMRNDSYASLLTIYDFAS